MENDNRKLAGKYFNETWDLLDKENRTADDNLEMIDKAFKSKYHWSLIGTPINFVRSDWIISRVFSTLKLYEAALIYAKSNLEIYETNHLDSKLDFFFAYESLARAYKGLGDKVNAVKYYALASDIIPLITDKEDHDYASNVLLTIKP